MLLVKCVVQQKQNVRILECCVSKGEIIVVAGGDEIKKRGNKQEINTLSLELIGVKPNFPSYILRKAEPYIKCTVGRQHIRPPDLNIDDVNRDLVKTKCCLLLRHRKRAGRRDATPMALREC